MRPGGRAVLDRKAKVNEAFWLDAAQLRLTGLFEKTCGDNIALSWKQEQETVASIGCKLYPQPGGLTVLQLSYAVSQRSSGERQSLNYAVRTVVTPCHFGGVRHWFICPLSKNGKACNRRCRILYLPHGGTYFGCRECYELTYESRQRHREQIYEHFEKPWQVLQKAKKRLARARTEKVIAIAAERVLKSSSIIHGFFDKSPFGKVRIKRRRKKITRNRQSRNRAQA